jgi:hypothetical protein
MPPDYFSELFAQIAEIVSNGLGIDGIGKKLDDPCVLALVEPYAFARLTYVDNDTRVSVVDGDQWRAIRRACVPRRGGCPEFGGVTPEVEVDPAVVPVRLLVLAGEQLESERAEESDDGKSSVCQFVGKRCSERPAGLARDQRRETRS